MYKSVNKICFFINQMRSIGLGEQHSVLHVKRFFIELANLGYQGPELTCPDHDSTRTGTVGRCLL